MTGKERFDLITAHKSDHCGFWHGNVDGNAMPAMFEYLKVKDHYDMGLKLKDTVCWITADSSYKHPEGLPAIDPYLGVEHHNLSAPGCFADLTDDDLDQVEKYPWPDVKYLDFTETIEKLKRAREDGFATLSGFWSCFYHNVSDYFGMENYFMKMYTDPKLVQCVTEHVTDYYLQANELFFKEAGDLVDATFFGNDFGTQLDVMISPECFDQFVMPYFRKFTEQGKRFGHKVVLHSCGSIYKVIGRLIDAGVDVLHPIQAQAVNMDALTLKKTFGDNIVYMGGIDMQGILTFGTVQEVKDEVARVRDILGPNYIVSPSHEHILPNVPPANIEALAEAAHL